jgi:hypothetical protein
MARRSPETLVDWLVVGIAPFLIMLLVGSLVFYLVEVFYHGDYPLRLIWVLGLFVMAIVCIARISMEEGGAYASLYAIPLAMAVGVALVTFVQIRGPLAPVGPLINWSLMGLVWWAAHKLTWDCTLIEGGKDFTGQGLMQTTGLDRFFRIKTSATDAAANATPANETPQPDLSGTSGAQPAAKALPVWEWWTKRDDRPHAPGVWVIYFSLAAIPLFGLGQWFVPAGDLLVRRRAFWLLVIYVAAGLALLMSTSFLSLRRYLRQRKLEMPLEMAGVWLGTGGVMVVALLLLASLLPRPNPEYSITHLAPDIKSPDLSPSRWGFGREGTKPKGEAPQTATQGKGGEKSQQGSSNQNAQPNGSQSGGKQGSNGKSGEGKSGSGSQQSNDQQSGQQGNQSSNSKSSNGNNSQNQPNQQSGGQQNSSQQNGEQKSPSGSNNESKHQSSEQNSGENKSQKKSQPNQQSPEQNSNKPPENQNQSQPNKQPDQSAQSQPPPPSQTPSTPPPTPWNFSGAIGQFFAWLLHGLKWIFYLLVAGAIAYYAWKNREWLLNAWQQLLKELRDLWAKWFGLKPVPVTAATTSAPAPPSHKRFADFADPFSSGLAARWPLAELVRYTFAAFEARGRDRDCPRGNDQTPLEYAAVVGQIEPGLATEFRSLADLYCQLAFAGGNVSPQAASELKHLWQRWR